MKLSKEKQLKIQPFAGGYNTMHLKMLVKNKLILLKYVIYINVSRSELQNGDEVVINQINSRLSNVVTIEGIGCKEIMSLFKGEGLDLLKEQNV